MRGHLISLRVPIVARVPVLEGPRWIGAPAQACAALRGCVQYNMHASVLNKTSGTGRGMDVCTIHLLGRSSCRNFEIGELRDSGCSFARAHSAKLRSRLSCDDRFGGDLPAASLAASRLLPAATAASSEILLAACCPTASRPLLPATAASSPLLLRCCQPFLAASRFFCNP